MGFEETRNDDAWSCVQQLDKRYDFAGIGLYRIAFYIGNHVFKFPLSDQGTYCNDMEGSLFAPEYAKSRSILWRGYICVMQERVQPASHTELKLAYNGKIPDWVSWIDCGQVGWSRDGSLKAYDYVHP